jgi:acetylglutamate kinase
MVGRITEVNADLLRTLCLAGTIPVIAPLARDKAGGKLNVNADSAAGMVAAALKAEKLVVLSDTHGIRTNIENPESRVSSVNKQKIQEMIDTGIINEGMLPKVEACLIAIDGGVSKAHIIDGRIPHSLLLEIYTDLGIGTEIVK